MKNEIFDYELFLLQQSRDSKARWKSETEKQLSKFAESIRQQNKLTIMAVQQKTITTPKGT